MNHKNGYKTVIFDCDGVLLNSNNLKTKCFYKTVLPYGYSEADDFKRFHIENFGLSRYEKFEFYLNNINKKNTDLDLNVLLNTYKYLLKKKKF